MRGTAAPAREDSQIRAFMDGFAQALRARDIDALMAHYAPDTVTFDIRPPAQVKGAQAYRKNFETWFASVAGPIDYELHDLRIAASGEVGFCHSLCHVRSTRTTGEKSDYWVRVTSGLRRTNGQWSIIHEHISMPIDLQTMQALPDRQS